MGRMIPSAYHLIKWAKDRKPRYPSVGRNGYALTSGIEVQHIALLTPEAGLDNRGTVLFAPVTSRAQTSQNCRVPIPASDIPRLIEVLTSIQEALDQDDAARIECQNQTGTGSM